MSTTSRPAITKMVRKKIGDEDFDQMISQPTSATIQLLITQIAEVESSFTTCQWKQKHGCLALVLDRTKMCFTIGINDLNCSPLAQSDAINPVIDNDMKGRELLALQEEQKTLWTEFDLQEAVKVYGVAAIVQVINKQYIKEKKKEYVDYNGRSIHSLIDHVRTWAIVTNKEKN